MLEELLKRADFIDVMIVLIASVAIVGFWRGAWHIMDEFIFPNDYLLSGIVTLIGGTIILLIMSKYK